MIEEMNKEIIEREQHNQKRIMELNKEIKRLKEEYMMLQNASDEVEEEKDKEIERLNKRIEDLSIINEEHKILNEMIRKELQQKENIIKEVREYIKNNDTTFKVNEVVNAFGIPSIEFTIEPWKKDVLEILDKGDKEKDNE